VVADPNEMAAQHWDRSGVCGYWLGALDGLALKKKTTL
jgi:hypothetical protein